MEGNNIILPKIIYIKNFAGSKIDYEPTYIDIYKIFNFKIIKSTVDNPYMKIYDKFTNTESILHDYKNRKINKN